MVLNYNQWLFLQGISPRTGVMDEMYRWNKNEIPYEISEDFGKNMSKNTLLFYRSYNFHNSHHHYNQYIDAIQKEQIIAALNNLQNVTCLIFIPKMEKHIDYISFTVR